MRAQTALQIDQLREVVERATARAEETDMRIEALAGLIASPERLEESRRLQERLVASQEQVAAMLTAFARKLDALPPPMAFPSTDRELALLLCGRFA